VPAPEIKPGEPNDAPYWRRHYGIAQRWTPTAAGRRGCLVLLFGAMAFIAIVLLVALIIAIR